MKKHVMVAMMMWACLAALGAVLAAPELRQLGAEQMGYYGASHEVALEYSHMTESAANVAQTNTVTLNGPCSVSWAGWVCDMPWDTTVRTNAVSLTYTASLGSQALVTAAQMASDQFRTYRSLAPTALSVTTTTTTTGPDTNLLTSTSTSTGTWPYTTVITNGQSVALTIITGAPGASHALTDMTRGRTRLFFRIW